MEDFLKEAAKRDVAIVKKLCKKKGFHVVRSPPQAILLRRL
jgi:hypothetical protein